MEFKLALMPARVRELQATLHDAWSRPMSDVVSAKKSVELAIRELKKEGARMKRTILRIRRTLEGLESDSQSPPA